MESWPVLLFLGILVLIFAWGVIGFIGKMQTTRENREIAENYKQYHKYLWEKVSKK